MSLERGRQLEAAVVQAAAGEERVTLRSPRPGLQGVSRGGDAVTAVARLLQAEVTHQLKQVEQAARTLSYREAYGDLIVSRAGEGRNVHRLHLAVH